MVTDEDARYREEESEKLFEDTDYAIVGVLGGTGFGDAVWVPGPTVEHPRGIRKVQDRPLAQAMWPDYVNEMLDYRTEVMLKNLEIYKQAVGNRIQVIWISGTDFGAQRGLYFSRNSFRELYKPH